MDAAQGKTALPHLQGASELGFCGRQPPLNLIPLLLRRRHSFLALCRARLQLPLPLLAQRRQRSFVLLMNCCQGGRQLAQLQGALPLPPSHLLHLLLPLSQLALRCSQLMLRLRQPPAAL